MREEAGQDWLGELAAAVADGRPLDWDAAESSARNADERASIRGLRAVAAIGLAHSDLTLSDSSEPLSVRSLLQGVENTSTPATWGSLQILDRVGRGRFGDVYRAWDPNLAREVALKLLRHRDIDSTSVHREVIEEGRLMARIRHENVVTVYGARRIDGRTGLWMEFVEGRTLEAELKERGPFTASEVANAGIELCRALTAVHDAGLIHRDVKAQNVLRNQSGRLRLGDFGTGREVVEQRVTADQLAGTPSYLAPEVFAGSQASVQSDIYSLGVLLFRLATGTYPIAAGSVNEIRAAHANHQRRSLNAVRPEFPRELTARIERAIEPNPSHRYRTAAEMETALTSAVNGLSGGHPRSGWKRAVFASLALALVATVTAYFIAAPVDRGPASNSARSRALPQNEPVSGRAVAAAEKETETTLVPATESRSELHVDDAGPRGLGVVDSATRRMPARVFRQIGGDDVPNSGRPSPDGRLVAFTDLSGAVWLLDLVSDKRWRIASAEPGTFVMPAGFSLDGSRVTYLKDPTRSGRGGATGRAEIRTASVQGGPTRLIWQAPDSNLVSLFHWAGDDDVLLVGRRSPSGYELMLVSASQGQIVASREAPATVSQATLSADGRYVAYDYVDPASGLREIDLWSVTSNAIVPLIRDAANDRSPMWTPDGRHLLFMSARTGSVALYAQRVENGLAVGVPILLDPQVGESWPLGLTTNGTLFLTRMNGAGDTYVVDVDPGTLKIGNEPRRASSRSLGRNSYPSWSPDSRQLAFVREEEDRRAIVIKSLDSGQETEFPQPSRSVILQLRWDADGKSLLFGPSLGGKAGLYRLDVTSGGVKNIWEGRFERFELVRQTGEILLSRLGQSSGGRIVRLDDQGIETVIRQDFPVFEMHVSHLGDQLTYSYPDAQGILVRVLDLVSPDNTRDFRIMKRPVGPMPPSPVAQPIWSASDRELVFAQTVTPTGEQVEPIGTAQTPTAAFWALDRVTGAIRQISSPMAPVLSADLSPDGRQLAFDSGVGRSELWVLENATAALQH